MFNLVVSLTSSPGHWRGSSDLSLSEHGQEPRERLELCQGGSGWVFGKGSPPGGCCGTAQAP